MIWFFFSSIQQVRPYFSPIWRKKCLWRRDGSCPLTLWPSAPLKGSHYTLTLLEQPRKSIPTYSTTKPSCLNLNGYGSNSDIDWFACIYTSEFSRVWQALFFCHVLGHKVKSVYFLISPSVISTIFPLPTRFGFLFQAPSVLWTNTSIS